jgi:hypothetical protein
MENLPVWAVNIFYEERNPKPARSAKNYTAFGFAKCVHIMRGFTGIFNAFSPLDVGDISMKHTMFVKAAAFLLLFAGLTVGASAQITISGGFALSQLDVSGSDLGDLDGGIGFGGNVYVDYILPINIPLSLGAEAGVDSAKLDSSVDDTILAIPVLARVAYHFDILPKLDLYVVGKIGIAFGSWKGEVRDSADEYASVKTPPGFAFGFDVGAAYYFTPTIGVFAEAGFDRYNLSAEIEDSYYGSDTLEIPFNRFFTLGISAKF